MRSRPLIAALSATLFTANGCSSEKPAYSPETAVADSQSEESDGTASLKSIDPAQATHGDLPTKRNDGHVFNAKYDVLIFVRLNKQGSGSHIARIHHFSATGNDFSSMKTRMEAAISYLRKQGNINSIPPGSLNSPTVIRSFKNMAFSAPSNVLIYFDNPQLAYRDVPLFFTEKLKNGAAAKKNKAFYDAENVDIIITDGTNNLPAKASYVRNYFTKGSGTGPGTTPITRPDKFIYAFNFNMSSPDEDDPANLEQLIFDPDGGNMGGGGPPP